MRVLVTGASGFLGRNLLLAKPQSWEVVAAYRRPDFPDFLVREHVEGVTPVRCDLRDQDQACNLARRNSRWDLVVYLAGLVDIPGSVAQPMMDLTANLLALVHLLEAVRCEHLIYVSSGAVYTGLAGVVSPQSPLRPDLPYAINKLAAEHYVRCYTMRRSHIGYHTILRFMGAYGPHEPTHKIYSRMLRSFVLGVEPTFTVYGDGSNLIDAMYVDDAVRGLLAAGGRGCASVTLDWGLGQPTSISELVLRTASVFRRRVELRFEGVAHERIEFRIDPSPLFDLIGFRPTVPYEEGIGSLADWLRKATA